jgi:hypothetical protein
VGSFKGNTASLFWLHIWEAKLKQSSQCHCWWSAPPQQNGLGWFACLPNSWSSLQCLLAVQLLNHLFFFSKMHNIYKKFVSCQCIFECFSIICTSSHPCHLNLKSESIFVWPIYYWWYQFLFYKNWLINFLVQLMDPWFPGLGLLFYLLQLHYCVPFLLFIIILVMKFLNLVHFLQLISSACCRSRPMHLTSWDMRVGTKFHGRGFLSSVIKCIVLVMVVALALFQQKNVVFFVEGKYCS